MQKRRRVEADASPYITLKIWNQDNSEFFARIKRCSKLSRLMAAYASHKPIEGLGTYVYFVEGGHRVHGYQTADDLGLEEGDQIDAMVELRGGSG